MLTWREQSLNTFLPAATAEEQFEVVTHYAREIGFEYCAYGLRMPVPVTRPKVETINNYPLSWQYRYKEANYLEIDPTVRHGLTSPFAVVWSPDVFASTPALWDEAQAVGLRIGWALSVRDRKGAVGMLTLARSSEALSPRELAQRESQMVWLTQISHFAFSRLLTPQLAPEVSASLTARELEVLQWTADGKTSGEIASILGLSERTVNFHLTNAVTKLEAPNKTAAAVRAAMLGLL